MTSFSDVTLSTPRLTLRPMVPGDADAVFAMRSDAQVQRYGSHLPWTDPQLAVAYIERNIRAMAEGSGAQFIIERREDGVALGTCTLFGIDTSCRHAEIGYVLLPAHWGHGYATEANTALLDWAFDTLDLIRVEADIDPRNTASARALERLAFTREGHLRERWIVGDEVSDSWIYGLLAREWRAHRAKA